MEGFVAKRIRRALLVRDAPGHRDCVTNVRRPGPRKEEILTATVPGDLVAFTAHVPGTFEAIVSVIELKHRHAPVFAAIPFVGAHTRAVLDPVTFPSTVVARRIEIESPILAVENRLLLVDYSQCARLPFTVCGWPSGLPVSHCGMGRRNRWFNRAANYQQC